MRLHRDSYGLLHKLFIKIKSTSWNNKKVKLNNLAFIKIESELAEGNQNIELSLSLFQKKIK